LGRLDFNIANLLLWARSEFNGYAAAGDIAENPNDEILNPKQFQMTKTQMIQTIGISTVVHTASFWSLDHWIFEFVSYFDIRIWYLTAATHRIIPSRVISKPGPLGPDSLLGTSENGLGFRY